MIEIILDDSLDRVNRQAAGFADDTEPPVLNRVRS